MTRTIFFLLLTALTGCVPANFQFRHAPIDHPIADGRYVISDTAYLYWGYRVDLTVANGRGVATIKDARSSFEVTDTLTYQTAVKGKGPDRFAGEYLSFEHRDRGWVLRLSNPVSGHEFVGNYKFRKRE